MNIVNPWFPEPSNYLNHILRSLGKKSQEKFALDFSNLPIFQNKVF